MKTKVLGLAVLCALVTAVSSLGASQPIVARALAVGKMQATTIHAKSGSMILETYTIKPGGSFGWHVHGAPVAVVVTRGTLTVFDPTRQRVRAVQGRQGVSRSSSRRTTSISRATTAPSRRRSTRSTSACRSRAATYIPKAEPAGCKA